MYQSSACFPLFIAFQHLKSGTFSSVLINLSLSPSHIPPWLSFSTLPLSLFPSFRHLCAGCEVSRGLIYRTANSERLTQHSWYTSSVCTCAQVWGGVCALLINIVQLCAGVWWDFWQRLDSVNLFKERTTKLWGYLCVCAGCKSRSHTYIHILIFKNKMNSPQALWKGDSLFSNYYTVYNILSL